ncbi:MAG: NUDIX domain-containing protein [Caldilineales bacterium]|nr:NUDIX domain-containing protein [Caldilineales bacterium]
MINDLPRRVCPRCDFIYWNNPLPVAGAAVIDENGWILLARRAVEPRLGWWNLPAGFMEWGESAEEAARREVREETGLEVELTGFLSSFGAGYDDLPWRSITYVFFYARPVGGTLAGGDDADLAQFYPPDQLPPNIAFTSNQAALARWHADRAAELPAAQGDV